MITVANFKRSRNMKSKITFTICAVLLGVQSALADASADLTLALVSQEKVYDTFGEIAFTLADIKTGQMLNLWEASYNREFPGKFDKVAKPLHEVIKNKELLRLVIHLDHLASADSLKKRDLAIRFYFHSLAQWLSNVANNPIYQSNGLGRGMNEVALRGFSEDQALKKCLAGKNLSSLISGCLGSAPLSALLQSAKKILNDKSFVGGPVVTSYSGFVGGNQISYLNQTPQDPDSIKYMAVMKSIMAKYVGKDVEFFKQAMTSKEAALTQFFNEENLPSKVDLKTLEFVGPHRIFHPTLPENPKVKNTLGEIMTAIEGAKESIFMDIFFLGGSMGAYVAKKLIKMVQTNPNLRVYFMADQYNGLGYAYEIEYIFNYLRAYAEKFPEDRIYVLPAQVTLKRTGLPDFMDLLVDDTGLEKLINDDQSFKQFVQQMDTYPKAKADHSKVFVIDGKNNETGVAFFGSKNFTDSSGSIAYDEVVKVEGPGVKVVLNSYYYDLFEAMSLVYDQGGRAYLENSYKKTLQKNPSDKLELIKTLLASVDVLERNKPGYSLEKVKVSAVEKGEGIFQVGENNVYGTIRTAQTQDIEAILTAQKQIIISDQLLYDSAVIEAIRENLRRLNSETEVFIMLESLSDRLNPKKEFQHVPNNLYISRLMSAAPNRVHVKWKKTPKALLPALKEANVLASKIPVLTSQKNVAKATQLADTYHLKTISVDGVRKNHGNACAQVAEAGDTRAAQGQVHSGLMPILISGSANKDLMTMIGGFREFQAAIFGDRNSVAVHDCLFWERWNNPEHSEDAVADDFALPPKLAEKMKPEEFLAVIRLLLQTSYNSSERVLSNSR